MYVYIYICIHIYTFIESSFYQTFKPLRKDAFLDETLPVFDRRDEHGSSCCVEPPQDKSCCPLGHPKKQIII